jgi:hypothetical protein
MSDRDADAEIVAVTGEINKLMDQLDKIVAVLYRELAPAEGPSQ